MGAVEPPRRYEWERLMRRVVIPQETDPRKRKGSPSPANVKYVAFVAAQYGDADGSRVRPGANRLAAVTGLSKDVVGKCLRRLVKFGFLEQIESGSSHGLRKRTSSYRLAIPEDLQERFELLDVDEKHPESDRACGKPVVRIEQVAPAPCDQPEQVAPAPGVPDDPAADHRAPAPPDQPIRWRQRLEQVAPAPTHQPIDQPQLRPDHFRPSTTVTPPTRETAALWKTETEPGSWFVARRHPARGVARVPHAAMPADVDHPGSAADPTAVDAIATVLLPLVPDPDPAARARHLRLVHSRPTRRPA